MNKKTLYVVGLLALVGVGYYIYTKGKTPAIVETDKETTNKGKKGGKILGKKVRGRLRERLKNVKAQNVN